MKLYLAPVLFSTLLFCCKPVYQQKSISSEVVPLADNSRTSLDWPGIYRGILPCADCSGIKTELTIKIDNTYILKRQYLGKDSKIIEDDGAVFWDQTGSNITLDVVDDQYKVGENALFKLDKEGKPITGNLASEYRLQKVDNSITNRNWELVSIGGAEISAEKIPTIKFDADANKVQGYGGCNNYSGRFELGVNRRLTISGIMATKMMCQNSVENEFFAALNKTSSYQLESNKLILKSGDTSLITFEEHFFE
ncbi:META domain-containing protein [Fulvivirga lutea]|uniref:Copper resistance protein NlpE N-terminal domain-containing protein n=1 Tax=Fulvivirga lutea TaxID=2810512 RepID=A0A974WH53_9BACT|nr:copper resistance protein NlpE N-terminal domain-containing protein [Fulvivirga lutea]QSE97022.1 copper resistance protein NlpE N-terminal domain-containing protein [Fulvivirga lutea]